MENRFRLAFLSRPENVGLARLAVAALAGQAAFTVNDLEEIKVAVSEAVSNAIVHGYAGRPDGWVEIEAWCDGERLGISVADHGVGIADVEAARRPAHSTDPERLGLGFLFMETFMDRLEVESRLGAGTRVLMEKAVNVPDSVDADAP
jgi:stage II sporulation protein AB (anti-sigma F factor)